MATKFTNFDFVKLCWLMPTTQRYYHLLFGQVSLKTALFSRMLNFRSNLSYYYYVFSLAKLQKSKPKAYVYFSSVFSQTSILFMLAIKVVAKFSFQFKVFSIRVL